MRADLEKTVFRADVLEVEMRFDEATKARIAAIARGADDAQAKKDAIARAAFGSPEVVARIRFARRVPLARFVATVRDDLAKAERAGMIDARLRAYVSASLPVWFAAIEDRGFRRGDRLLYRGSRAELHTMLVGADGEVLVDQVDRGEQWKRALLAGYFAPGATLRDPLVDSAMR